MRCQGKITTWKDDQGYGFVVQNGDSEQVFLHIKAFRNRQGRPVGNEIVAYDVSIDAKGRKRAENVEFVSNRATISGASGTGTFTLTLAAAFLVFLLAATATGKLPIVILGVYVVASLAAYLAYASDKSAAQQGQWRTKEDTLHLLSLIGGWPGALLAQKTLRHKNRKASFQAVFWTTVTLNCGVLGWLLTPMGGTVLRSIHGATG
jgi:uncharacterized membrane protein YsdA (DUF1294 family)/cold shock CspA family protein